MPNILNAKCELEWQTCVVKICLVSVNVDVRD